MVTRRDATGQRGSDSDIQSHPGRGHAGGGSPLSDEDLAQRMFAGDGKATRHLLERYRGPLYGTLLRLTRNPADAEELYQETFLRALKSSSTFDRSRRFKPWIFTIAKNLARDRAKRAAHRATPELRAPDELPEPKHHDTEQQWVLRADLFHALDELTEHHRKVIELRYFDGLEEPEIAEAANIPRGTVKSRLHHAIRKLRDLMTAGATT